MSGFFRALEQAERERALRQAGPPLEPEGPGEGPLPLTRLPEGPDRSRPAERPRSPGQDADPVPEIWQDVGEADSLEGVEEHLVSLLAPASFAAEQYRNLRLVVEQLRQTDRGSIVAVTSPGVGDGKTVTALNLAGSLAQAPGARVLLLEADLRRPSVRRYLGLDPDRRPGLAELILDPRLQLAHGVTACRPFGLAVLSTPHAPATPYEILKSPRLGEVLERARATYDYVVLDTPPLIPVPDCRVIGQCVDGFFVVVSAHQTPRKLLEEALRHMDAQKLLGIVFNQDDGLGARYYRPYPRSRDGVEGDGWRRRWNRPLFGNARSWAAGATARGNTEDTGVGE